MKLAPVFMGVICSVLLASMAIAEKKPIVIGQNASMEVEIIVDTVVGQNVVQLVLNPIALTDQNISEAMPDYCLLNAEGRISDSQLLLEPGSLVCVADDKRILEGKAQGKILDLPGCTDCTQLMLIAGDKYPLELSADLELILQIRADGQSQ